jgi:1-acyl-sn-glycerol-3-phosphate acyltransferase
MAEQPLRVVVPPKLVRRAVLAPLLLVFGLLALVLAPVLLPAWLLALLVPAIRPVLRMLTVAVAYLLIDSAALLASVALWVASGFGRRLGSKRFLDAHYALMGWMLESLVRVVRAVFGMRFEVERPAGRVPEPHRPVIVLSRHSGPGDSFLVVHELLSTYHRRPRVIMKDTLQLDPGLDVLANRLPNAFIAPRPGSDVGILAEIGALAAGLGRDDAMLIFPEGANFTPRRRLRSIAYLERLRMVEQAAEARTLEHVMAPRPGGVFAATGANLGADVVFVAHTGVRELGELADTWRTVPQGRVVRARWWRVPSEQVPRQREEQERWLYRWWGELDDWIDAQAPGG